MFTAWIVINSVIVLAGLFISRFGFSNLRKYTQIRNLATSKIKSLAAGEVEIKGKVFPIGEDVLVSPLQGKRCVSFNLDAYKLVHTKNGNRWEHMYNECRSRPFMLGDDTGYIIVDPEGASIRNDSFFRTESTGPLKELKDKAEKDTEKLPDIVKKLVALSMDGRYKYEETIVPEGEQCYVLGHTAKNPNFNNEENLQSLMIARHEKDDFIISDEPEPVLMRAYLAAAIIFFLFTAIMVFYGVISIFNIIDWIGFMGGFTG